MESNRSKNRALVSFVVLPMLFLTVALLGGLRVSAETYAFIFIPPPLVTLVLAVLLSLLFVRANLIELPEWVASTNPPLTNVSHIWMLFTLFFASAQAFNSVLPERGLLHWLFSFFFLWTLWNNLFSWFDARRLVRSLAVLFATAFVLKHLLLAGLYSQERGWLQRLAGALLQGVSLGTLDTPVFAPASGYISFFTLALFVAGLLLIPFARNGEPHEPASSVVKDYRKRPHSDFIIAREAISEEPAGPVRESDRILENGRE
ncbi:MAG TPA: hypothetical protein VFB82_01095 [Blastocatellia bacterium]|jgi:hypothetical protein|nr:hypothetical protein [Blastocatellia bacterium]